MVAGVSTAWVPRLLPPAASFWLSAPRAESLQAQAKVAASSSTKLCDQLSFHLHDRATIFVMSSAQLHHQIRQHFRLSGHPSLA